MTRLNIPSIVSPPSEFEDLEEVVEYLKKLSAQLTSILSDMENKFNYLRLDDLYTTEDNTDLDASTSKHGLMAKLDKVKLDSL